MFDSVVFLPFRYWLFDRFFSSLFSKLCICLLISFSILFFCFSASTSLFYNNFFISVLLFVVAFRISSCAFSRLIIIMPVFSLPFNTASTASFCRKLVIFFW